jgi:hypothetical protein
VKRIIDWQACPRKELHGVATKMLVMVDWMIILRKFQITIRDFVSWRAHVYRIGLCKNNHNPETQLTTVESAAASTPANAVMRV